MKKKLIQNKIKEYVVIYRSQEHYEVLGWVKALSIDEAKEIAKKDLTREAKYYAVKDAEIFELGENRENILFNI